MDPLNISLSLSVSAAVLAIVTTTISHIFFKKYATGQQLKFLILTFFFFLCAPVCSYLALKNLSIDQLYICTAFVPVFTILSGKIIFKEIINRNHIIGISLTIFGTSLYLL